MRRVLVWRDVYSSGEAYCKKGRRTVKKGFANIYEFTEYIESGKELEFSWEGTGYRIAKSGFGYVLSKTGRPEAARHFATASELLNADVDGEKLRRLAVRMQVTRRS